MQNLRAFDMVVVGGGAPPPHRLADERPPSNRLRTPLVVAFKRKPVPVVTVILPHQRNATRDSQDLQPPHRIIYTLPYPPLPVGRTQRKEGTPHRRTLQRRRKEPRTQPSPLPEILRPPEMGRNRTHSPSLRQNRRGAPVQPGTTKERVSVCNTQQTRKRDTHTGKS